MGAKMRHLGADGVVHHVEIDDETGLETPLEDCDDFLAKGLYLQRKYGMTPAKEFYRYLFPEGSFERLGHQEDEKPNGVALVITKNKNDKNVGRHVMLTDGLEQLDDLLRKDYVICSPIGYYGRSRKADNALYMYALTLDIDYVGLEQLKLLDYWGEQEIIPTPTFIVNSGHGVHLYYVFENPIPMYKRNQLELRKLKQQLIKQIWTEHTSTKAEALEALGVVQGFRMVGSRSKIGMYAVSAYQTGERVGIRYLNAFVMPEHKAKISDSDERLTIEQAREKYPDWYERVVLKREPKGRWHIKRDLYDWYKRRIETEASFGHRYFCMMVLAIYAQKCDITKKELIRDAMHFTEVFNAINPEKPFTWDEATKALEAYNECYVRFPRASVERVTAISMPANKRNGQKLEWHLEDCRSKKANMKRRGQPFRNPEGRPPKRDLVRQYAVEHPGENHSQIARALGVSRPTVIKWLKDD